MLSFMKAKEFFDLVTAMRAAQRRVERNRSDRMAITYARDYERKVDEEIKRVQLITKETMNPRLDF